MQTVSRLIQQFVPKHYQLSLNLQRTDRIFSGTATINGHLQDDASAIMLHSKGLVISSVVVDGKTAEWSHGSNDELSITQDGMTAGRHIVVVAFDGVITDAMHGLYPCYYDDNGVKKELLATQFESHHAREVFPCIDEPEAKATFDVTLTTEKDVQVIGNMPVQSQSLDGDQLVTTFDTTPRMSTYLLAWVTGDLHKKTAITKRGVEVNVWATPAQPASSLDFALDIATRTIDFFDEYFDTPYPLPKSDHIALPDFSSGAMENWGLITYRETTLLAEPATTSISSKHYIATVIAHELSHQWFGNLVTMKWWNNLWLNESFATLMEYIAIDALHPEWNVWLDFATTESVMALRRDAIDGVQSVQTDVHHPDEISTLFDGAIVYAKGARLLRMLQQYVGDEAFQTGLKAYFAAHAYSNTEGGDLWDALASASGKDVAGFMNTWISQPGYPVLSVDSDENGISLAQRQLFVGPHEPSDKLWPIPLSSTHEGMPELLTERSATIAQTQDAALRFNVGDSAHFITHYSTPLMSRLIEEISTGNLTPLDRAQLLNEQTLLARAGVISSAELIPLLQAYHDETTEAVWDIMSMTVGELKKFVEGDDASEQQLRTLARTLAKKQYDRLGWNAAATESESDSKLRTTIISIMLYGEDEDAVATANELFASQPLAELDPELRPLIIGAAVRSADVKSTIIDELIDMHRTSHLAELQQDIASGITSTKHPEKIEQILALLKDETVVRPQDAARWFVWTIRNRYGRNQSWQWLQDNWDWVVESFSGDKSYDDFPRYAASSLVTRQQLERFTSYFAEAKNEPALARTITMGISEIQGRVELIERDNQAVRDALAKLA